MARSKTKPSKHLTTAYAASQPLFSAVRRTLENLSHQETALQTAKTLIQKLHVGIKDVNNSAELREHERYMDCCVQAFKMVTESYQEVFVELARITGPDEGTGKGKDEGFEAFEAMRDAAQASRGAAARWGRKGKGNVEVQGEVKGTGKAARDGHKAEESSDVSESGMEGDGKVEGRNAFNKRPAETEVAQAGTPPQKVQRLAGNKKFGDNGTLLCDEGAEKPAVPFASLGSNEKKEPRSRRMRRKQDQTREAQQQAEVRSKSAKGEEQIPDRRRSSPDASMGDASKPVFKRNNISTNGSHDTEPMDAEPTNAANIEYENVDSEVERRLKAKEQKMKTDEAHLKAKKAEKKRKRDSAGSNIGVEEGAFGRFAAVEKPKRKRSRIDRDATLDAQKPSTQGQQDKERKKRPKEVEFEAVDGEMRQMKRKKSR
ncbi:hypothetical protein MBLNU230_g6528t1 [Neophaeotheca triangularis]